MFPISLFTFYLFYNLSILLLLLWTFHFFIMDFLSSFLSSFPIFTIPKIRTFKYAAKYPPTRFIHFIFILFVSLSPSFYRKVYYFWYYRWKYTHNDIGNMFEARLAQGNILKLIIDAMKDLVSDANFECSDNEIAVQVIYLKWIEE